ncbi:hypothetical protein BGY98DRAFT_1119988 [Russula aff. rugulosa BPL654]|nr:hypothetical protein BGY98DRAFT_1119988 [Russula aff. rugulosa BPL654]
MVKADERISYRHESKSSDHGPQQRNSTRKRKGLEKDFNIGTWNVRSLKKTGKIEELKIALKNYKMEITALQELKMQGKGIEKHNKTSLTSTLVAEIKLAFGCGFAIRGPMRDKVIGWYPFNEHPEAKDAFYDELDRVYESCPNYDTKIILGDLNAQIGCEKVYEGTIGRASLKAKNKNETRRFVKARDNETTDNGSVL